MSDIKQILTDYSAGLGFCKIGFAKAEIPAEAISRFKDWLNKNYYGDMDYLAAKVAERENPGLALPGVKTIIILAMSYKTPHKHPDDIDYNKNGKISRYAWGGDYHDIIKKKLKLFSQKLAVLYPEAENKYYVDSGPVLEKYWAERSGIGWQGKNGVIINRDYGSFIYLGSFLTTAEFEADKPAKEMCGICQDCISACPTRAIESPKIINPKKCISYWTLEVKPEKDIPDEIASKSDGWIFGCDICQNVCPWNISAPNSGSHEFYPGGGMTTVNYEEIMLMSAEEFRERFKKSPVKRLKLEGFKRNIRCIGRK